MRSLLILLGWLHWLVYPALARSQVKTSEDRTDHQPGTWRHSQARFLSHSQIQSRFPSSLPFKQKLEQRTRCPQSFNAVQSLGRSTIDISQITRDNNQTLQAKLFKNRKQDQNLAASFFKFWKNRPKLGSFKFWKNRPKLGSFIHAPRFGRTASNNDQTWKFILLTTKL